MNGIPLTRCQFLIPFAVIHDEIGAPTETLLAKFRLPTSLDERADHYIPILPAVRFAEAAQRSQGITDIGFQASPAASILSPERKAPHHHRPLTDAVHCVCSKCANGRALEDTILNMWLERCDNDVRVCSQAHRAPPACCILNTLSGSRISFSIHIVRQFAGADWAPLTMAFEARYTPSRETQAFWPNTRFLSGQHASWIDVPVSLLEPPQPLRTKHPPKPI